MATAVAPDNSIYQLGSRARDDFRFCAGELLWIRPKNTVGNTLATVQNASMTTLRLNWPQQYIWERYMQPAWDRKEPLALIVLKARREGVSTLVQAWHFHKATFYRGQSCYLTAHDDDTAQELFRMSKTFYDHLLVKLRPPTERHNRMELEYKAPWGSSMRTRTAKYSDIGHGKTIQHWHACLRGDTLVILADGNAVPIREVCVGDQVRTHTGAVAAVKARMETPSQLVPGQGRILLISCWLTSEPIACTPDHKIWTREGWKAAETIKPSDWLGIPVASRNPLLAGDWRGPYFSQKYTIDESTIWVKVRDESTIWLNVRSIAEAEEYAELVYDLEVDHPDHSFETIAGVVANSEVAYYPEDEMHGAPPALPGLLEAVPTTGASSIIFESTAYASETWFHNLWLEAERLGNRGRVGFGSRRWQTCFLPWFWHPDHQAEWLDDDPDFTNEERELIGRYKLNREQIAWRRGKETELEMLYPGNGARLLRQQYPACIAGNMRVGTNRGLLPIEALTHEGHTAQGAIAAHYAKGVALVWEVTTELGYRLEATDDHRVCLENGAWTPVRKLQGRRIKLVAPLLPEDYTKIVWHPWPSVTSTITIDERWGLFLGFFMGDGAFDGQTLSFACDRKDPDVVERLLLLIRDLFSIDGTCRVVGSLRGGCEIRVWDTGLQEVFRAMGLLYAVKGTRNGWRRCVYVPACIWASPPRVVRAFLQGIFESDGFAGYGYAKMGVVSKYQEFIRDIQLLLLSFGITSRQSRQSQRIAKNDQVKFYSGFQLTLRASEALRFVHDIGFVSARKRGRTERWLTQTHTRRDSRPFADTVKTVIPLRFAEVFDLSMDTPGHAFDANGFLVHNCSEEPFLLSGTCVFPEKALEELRKQEFAPTLGFNIVKTGQWRHTCVQEKSMSHASLVMWEPPLKDRGFQYTLGVDVSRGVGRDDSAVVVMRMPGYHVVAHWYDNYVAPKQLAYVVAAIARMYGIGSGTLPICTVEINDAGILVNSELETMRAFEPLDIFVWEYWDRVGQQTSRKTGWQTTHGTKEVLLGIANSLLLANEVRMPSRWIREDMAKTIEIRPGVARTGGCDLVIAWLLALMTAYRKIGRHEEEFRGLDWTRRPVFSQTFGGDTDGERQADMLARSPQLWENQDGVVKAKDPRWAAIIRRRSSFAEQGALW